MRARTNQGQARTNQGQASKPKINYGLNCFGVIRIFSSTKKITSKRNNQTYDITDFWYNVSEKNEDGTYYNKSMKVIFSKELKYLPDHNTLIDVNGRFLIVGQGEYRTIGLYVTDFKEVEE